MTHFGTRTYVAKLRDVAERIGSLQDDLVDSPELNQLLVKSHANAHTGLMNGGACLVVCLEYLAKELEKAKPASQEQS